MTRKIGFLKILTLLILISIVIIYLSDFSVPFEDYLDKGELQVYIQNEIPLNLTIDMVIERLETGYFSSYECFTFEGSVRAEMQNVSLVGYDDISCYVPAPEPDLNYYVAFVFQNGLLEDVYINTVKGNFVVDI